MNGLGSFLGSAPLYVSALRNPDGADVRVCLCMTDPETRRRLSAILDGQEARAVAAALIVAAECADNGTVPA